MIEPEVASRLRDAVADVRATDDLWAAIVARHRRQRGRRARALTANLALLLAATLALGGLLDARLDAARRRAVLDPSPDPSATVEPRPERPRWIVEGVGAPSADPQPRGPEAAGGLVLVPTGFAEPGRVRAFDARTGQPRWAHDVGSTAFIIAIGREQAVVTPQYGLLKALDLGASGRERWRFPLRDGEAPERGTIAGDRLYVGTSFPVEGDVGAPVVYAIELATGRQAWRTTLDAGTDLQWGAPVVAGGLVLVADTPSHQGSAPTSHLHALDAGTGQVRWKADLETGDQGFHSERPILAEGLVHMVSPSGALLTFDAASGTTVWRRTGATLPHLVGVRGGQLIAVMDGSLLALDRRTGARRWATALGEGDGERFAVLAGGTVHAVWGSAGAAGVAAAIDADSGVARWRAPVDDRPVGPPLQVGASVYVATERRLVGFDARTGAMHFTSDQRRLATGPVATPDGIVVASADGDVLNLGFAAP